MSVVKNIKQSSTSVRPDGFSMLFGRSKFLLKNDIKYCSQFLKENISFLKTNKTKYPTASSLQRETVHVDKLSSLKCFYLKAIRASYPRKFIVAIQRL